MRKIIKFIAVGIVLLLIMQVWVNLYNPDLYSTFHCGRRNVSYIVLKNVIITISVSWDIINVLFCDNNDVYRAKNIYLNYNLE